MNEILARDIDRTLGALEVAEYQLAYWQDRVALLRGQLAAKLALQTEHATEGITTP